MSLIRMLWETNDNLMELLDNSQYTYKKELEKRQENLEKTLKEILTSKSDVKSVGFVIGPEGGFDLSETEKLHSSGIDTVTLGKRILRTETAGEAVLAMTMYEIGDIN